MKAMTNKAAIQKKIDRWQDLAREFVDQEVIDDELETIVKSKLPAPSNKKMLEGKSRLFFLAKHAAKILKTKFSNPEEELAAYEKLARICIQVINKYGHHYCGRADLLVTHAKKLLGIPIRLSIDTTVDLVTEVDPQSLYNDGELQVVFYANGKAVTKPATVIYYAEGKGR